MLWLGSKKGEAGVRGRATAGMAITKREGWLETAQKLTYASRTLRWTVDSFPQLPPSWRVTDDNYMQHGLVGSGPLNWETNACRHAVQYSCHSMADQRWST